MLPPENAEDLVRAGWTKADLRNALFERTTRTVAWSKRQGRSEDALKGSRGGPITPEAVSSHASLCATRGTACPRSSSAGG